MRPILFVVTLYPNPEVAFNWSAAKTKLTFNLMLTWRFPRNVWWPVVSSCRFSSERSNPNEKVCQFSVNVSSSDISFSKGALLIFAEWFSQLTVIFFLLNRTKRSKSDICVLNSSLKTVLLGCRNNNKIKNWKNYFLVHYTVSFLGKSIQTWGLGVFIVFIVEAVERE